MSVFDSIATTPVVVRASDPLLDDAQLAAVASSPATAAAPWSPTVLIAPVPGVDCLGWTSAAGGDTGAHRAVPGVDGGAGAGGLDGRSATVDGVRLLPVCPPRRSHPGQPDAPRAPSPSSHIRPAGDGPRRVRRLPVHGRADLARPRRACRVAGPQRPARQRSVRRRHRRPRVRTRPPGPADRR